MSAGAAWSDIRLQLLAPSRVPQGGTVPFTLRIVNAGRRPATLYVQGRPPAFDLMVHDASGRLVWRRLAGASVAMVLGVRQLAPGDVVDLEDVWRQTDAAGNPVPPGRYLLTGVVPGEPDRDLRSRPAELDILAPGGAA